MLQLIIGPVCAGKTMQLIIIADKLKSKNHPHIIIGNKNCCDDHITSRFHNVKLKCDYVVSALSDISDIYDKHKTILIDELQFYSDAKECILQLLNNGCNVYATCLNGDYNQRMFDSISQLIPYAQILQCEGVCHFCNSPATCSIRQFKHEDPYDRDQYLPVCYNHTNPES